MRQKITILGFFSEDNGLTSFINTNYRTLVAEGYEFNIINIANYRPARELKKFGTYYEVPFYFSDINFKNIVLKRRNFNHQLKKIYDSCCNTSSTIHLYLNSLCDPNPVTLAHKSGFERIILHAYADCSKTFNFAEKQLHRVGCKVSEKYITDFVAVNQKTANFFYSKHFQQNVNFKIIKNGIPVKKQRYHEEQNIYYRKRYEIDTNDFVIGNIGRFISAKNQIFLIESFNLFQKIYPNAKLVLIGDGPKIEDVRQRVYELHLENKVIFTGFLENTEEVQNIFNVFAYPAIYDELSLSTLHSLANGAIAVVSDQQELEANKFSTIIPIPLDDPQKWADEFHRLSQKRYNRSIQSEKSISELISMGYTTSTSTKNLMQLYGRLQWED